MSDPANGTAKTSVATAVRGQILLVEDKDSYWKDMHALLDESHDLHCVADPPAARHHLLGHSVDVILLDLEFYGFQDGFEYLEELKAEHPEIPVIILSESEDSQDIVRAMRLGAIGYVPKAVAKAELELDLATALELRRGRIRIRAASEAAEVEIVGRSPAISRVRLQIKDYAAVEKPVLITGEAGTGKELCARALHALGPHPGEPFIAVNCAAFTPTLLESELFGHEQAAFAEAHRRRIGRLQEAGQGLVYLDGIADMSLDVQQKLSRVLTERRFRPLGSRQELPLRARIVVGSNRDLVREVRERRFYQPLLLQLNGLRLALPPLRERIEDLEPLAHHLVFRKAKEMALPVPARETTALRVLQRQPWPGNIRELATVIENALIHAKGGALAPTDFQLLPEERYAGYIWRDAKKEAELRFMRDYYTMLLRAAHGCIAEVSRMAGVPRQTVYRHLEKAGLDQADFTDS